MSEVFKQQTGHQISEQSIEAARRHAEQIKQHGQEVEKIALSAKNHKVFDVDPEGLLGNQLELVEQLGQEIQMHGQESLAHAQAVEETSGQSVQDYTAAVEAHAKATAAHVQANRVLLSAIQKAIQNQAERSKRRAIRKDKEG